MKKWLYGVATLVAVTFLICLFNVKMVNAYSAVDKVENKGKAVTSEADAVDNVTTQEPVQPTTTEVVQPTTQVTTQATTQVTTEKPAPKVYKKPGKAKLKGYYKNKKIKLTWKKVKRAKLYIVYRKNKKGKLVEIGRTKKLTYYDKKAKAGKTYVYRVVAAYYTDDNRLIKGKKSNACSVFADDIDPTQKMIALTFDDGPGPYTSEIVSCLKRYNSKATFFVVGNRVNTEKSALKEAYDIGCEIGNHSFDHSDLSRLSEEEIREQMEKTDERVKKIIGQETTVMRTPYGSTGKTVKDNVGKPIILWSVDTLDWKTRNTQKTIDSVLSNAKDGSVVLMHDIHEPTKRAAVSLIPKLRDRGYQLVTVSELARYRGYEMKKGNVYYNFYWKENN